MGIRGMAIGYWCESPKERDLGRPRSRWVDNIKTDLRVNGWDQWRALLNILLNFRVPKNAGNFLSSCTTGGFSRRAQLHE
jgi:hypothetical protein